MSSELWQETPLEEVHNLLNLQQEQGVIVIRHGRAECNADEYGRIATVNFRWFSPQKLDLWGEQQAIRTAKKVEAVLGHQPHCRFVSSELERCKQTLKIVQEDSSLCDGETRAMFVHNLNFNEICPGYDTEGCAWEDLKDRQGRFPEPECLIRARLLIGLHQELLQGGFREGRKGTLMVCTHHNLILHLIDALVPPFWKELLQDPGDEVMNRFRVTVQKYERLVEYGSFLHLRIDEQGKFRADLHTQDVR